MRSLTILAAVLALSLGMFATPTLAGGWAVTTFDDMPGQFVAGHEYALGYTIRQHGQTPINVDKTEINATATSGRTLSFPGRSQGAVGHYVATVYFPAGGTYSWQVTQGPFAPQDLATVNVLGAAGTVSSDKAATDKAAAGKALPAEQAAAADKAATAEKAAVADKAAAAAKATVADKSATGAAPASAPATQSDPVRTALPFAAAAAAAMFVWRLATMLRATRRTRATTGA
jgi:hypothetical protein